MASTKNRGRTAREAVLTYCTYWTQAAYLTCWPRLHEVSPDATTAEKKAARLAVARELRAMLVHEVAEQDDTVSASEPKREPTVLSITGDLGSDSEPDIMAGSFLGTYGVLEIDTVGHWTYRASEARLREIKENEPDWFAHYDRFFVTHKDGFVQMLTISLCRRRNAGVEKTNAFATVGDRAPGGTFGNNEPDLRLATARDIASKLPDPNQFDEPAPVPLWVEGKPDDGMPRREVTQDELRHLRFYPERDELSGGGLKFEGLLFFDAAERLSVDEARETPEPKSQRSKAVSRNKLKLWLEGCAKTPVLTKRQCLEAAQIELNTPISMNMLNEAWRDAELPKKWREQGRRSGT